MANAYGDMHTSLPDFALWERKNKRTHIHIHVSNFFHRQVSELAKVNENLLAVFYQALFEVKIDHINCFQQKWVPGAVQPQL